VSDELSTVDELLADIFHTPLPARPAVHLAVERGGNRYSICNGRCYPADRTVLLGRSADPAVPVCASCAGAARLWTAAPAPSTTGQPAAEPERTWHSGPRTGLLGRYFVCSTCGQRFRHVSADPPSGYRRCGQR
jgi:hypothetical protein